MKQLVLISFFSFWSSLCLHAQNNELEVHSIKGKNYYIHVVEAGNTLYSISKKYDIPIEIIEKENASVADGLSLGEKIFIPVKKDTTSVAQTSDGNFFIHKVEKGRTLYSIAKEFNIQQKDIIALNPELDENGIQEGQEIKIPVKEIKQQIPDSSSVKPKSNYITHFVKSGETLYSLSKTYQVSIDSIKIVNNGLLEGLKVGQNIFIPIEAKKPLQIELKTISIDTNKLVKYQPESQITKKSSYKIALMLPFYLEENEAIPESPLEKKKIYPRSTFAVEFYQGFVVALDSISRENAKFELFVYDSKGQDSIETDNILKKIELKQMDLIVGPLYASNFDKVAHFAAKNNIPIVSPVKLSNKTLLGNENVFKVVPSKTSSIHQIVKLVADSFYKDNLIAVQYQNNQESVLAEVFVKEYNSVLLKKTDTSRYSPVKKVVVTKSDDIVSLVKPNVNNVIFLPTNNTVFLTNLFTALISKLKLKEYSETKITLIGMEEWLNLENIDVEYFQQLNIHLPVSQFVNFESEGAKAMSKKYHEKTKTFPTNNAFLGFDIANYFGMNLIQYGKAYLPNQSNEKQISTYFEFFKTGVESGYENTYVRLIKYDNYQLKIVY